MIRLLILGATGSIGTTCLNALSAGNEDIKVVGMTASANPELQKRAEAFGAKWRYIEGSNTTEIRDFIEETEPDIVLNAISGVAGLPATLSVIERGIDIALANKESVVMGGRFMLSEAKKNGVRIIPVDSEHSAIYHLLMGKKAEKLIITASGGPFLGRKDLSGVTIEEALHHPTWKMGKKITIDSATLANKGLEVMEASLLFGFPPEKIEVVIHRESVIHSMIETSDGAVYALMSPPDMTLPIISAIRGEGNGGRIAKPLPFSSSFSLTFSSWDRNQFPMLDLAYEALSLGGCYRTAYAAADETAVNAFLCGHIAFQDIYRITAEVISRSYDTHEPQSHEAILETEKRARREAEALC